MKKIQKGMHVWFFDSYDTLQDGIVDSIQLAGGIDYALFRNNGGAKCEDCYPSKNACLQAKLEKDNAEVLQIQQSIQTVEDLVRYMYNHTVSCAEEYTNWNARKAVAIRAKELLGIEL